MGPLDCAVGLSKRLRCIFMQDGKPSLLLPKATNAPLSGAEVRSTAASAPWAGQAASGASGDWLQFDDWNDASYARLVFGKDGIGLSELAEEVVSLFAFKHFRMRPIGSPLFFNRD